MKPLDLGDNDKSLWALMLEVLVKALEPLW
jgi:hypothetical protein